MSASAKQLSDVMLSPERIAVLQRALTALRRDTVAQCVLLADTEGRRVVQVGTVQAGVLDTVLPVLAEEILVVSRLSEAWHEDQVLSLHHYEGNDFEVYAASSADVPLLLVLVVPQRPRVQSGVLWLLVRRAMRELRWVVRQGLVGEGEALPLGSLTLAQARDLGLLGEEPAQRMSEAGGKEQRAETDS
ncbi:MAG: hypothetical protein PVI59_01915 [Anaerolineae bacterium]